MFYLDFGTSLLVEQALALDRASRQPGDDVSLS